MSEQRMIEPGSTLAGRYRVGEQVGRSDMAEVYRGMDTQEDRAVALKVLTGEFASDENFVSRFVREAKAAEGLDHPNIARVYEAGTEGEIAYVVMEFVDGQTLQQILEQAGKLEPARATKTAEAVAEALAFAHERGVVHQDIRPGNIMIGRSGEVKVMDLGIRQTTAIETAAQMGTATYLSPEQARGERTAQESDIYSLGVVLYEMVAGRPPFTGSSPVAVAFQHAREEPKPPSELESGLPESLDALIIRLLSKKPSDRPTASQLVQELQALEQGPGPVSAPAAAGVAAAAAGTVAAPAGQAPPIAAAPPPPTTTVPEPAADKPSETAAASTGDAEPPPAPEGAKAKVTEQAPTELIESKGIEPATMILGGVGRGTPSINPRWVATGIVGAIALVGLAYFLLFRSTSVQVPNLIGANAGAAQAQLFDLGLKVQTIAQEDPNNVGRVVEQAPPAGQLVGKGTTVILTVGQAPVAGGAIPDVTNLTQADATQAIQAAGFALGNVTQQDCASCSPGVVISQDPAAGTAAAAGTAVNIVVAQHQGPVLVPNVTCVRLNLAANQLQDAHLLVTIAGQEANDLCPTNGNFVARQDPVGGSTVKAGSIISLWTTQPLQSPSPSPGISPTPSPHH